MASSENHLKLAKRILLHSRGQKALTQKPFATLRRMPVIRLRYDRPDRRRFSFCQATIKPRKQFAARNSHKGDGRTTVWAVLFNDGTLKRRGHHLIHFRHELRQIPLPPVEMHFRQQLFRPPISDFDSQITVICNGSVSRPHFRSQQLGTLCCISHHLQLVDCSANCVSVTSSFRSLCFFVS